MRAIGKPTEWQNEAYEGKTKLMKPINCNKPPKITNSTSTDVTFRSA